MRKLAVLASVLGTILAAGLVLAGQGEERLYDAQGRYQGRATPDAANPRQKSLYGPQGEYQGRVMTDPATGERRAYDSHGKYLGRTSGDRMPQPKE